MIAILLLKLALKVFAAIVLVPMAFGCTWMAVKFARMTPSEWEFYKLQRGLPSKYRSHHL